MKTEQDILNLIAADRDRMAILNRIRRLNLPDWWIGAGFVRNLVWDELHDYAKRTPLNDIDVIYFDPAAEPIEDEKHHWQMLKSDQPELIWSVTNLAHRHLRTGHQPYSTATDGLAHWVETATCVGVRLDKEKRLQLTAPHGIEDLVDLEVRMNPFFIDGEEVYQQRQIKKNWLAIWPKLKITY